MPSAPTLFVPIVPPEFLPKCQGRWAMYKVACLHQVGLQATFPTPRYTRPCRVAVYRAYSRRVNWHWLIPLVAFQDIPPKWFEENVPKIVRGETVGLIIDEWGGAPFRVLGFRGEALTPAPRLRCTKEGIWWWEWW